MGSRAEDGFLKRKEFLSSMGGAAGALVAEWLKNV